jgi:DNA-binding CsgD family transcriptional regulator
MFLEDHKVERLLNLIRRINTIPPWQDPQGFLAGLNRLVPCDRTVAFIKVDPITHRILPSPLTLTNVSGVESIQDHNDYFWRFKKPILDQIAQKKFLSFHNPTTLSTCLPRDRFREYQSDYWAKHRMRFSYACYRITPQGYLATYFTRSRDRDFTEEEQRLLDLLSPHLELAASAAASDSATFFMDTKGAILWSDSRTETTLKENPTFAVWLRQSIPFWLKQLSLDPFQPLRAEWKEETLIHRFHISQSGFGQFPLFKVYWTSTEETAPLSTALLDRFAQTHRLSPREREVLALAVAGKQAKEMAGALDLAVDTVREYLGSVYRKVGVDGRGPLVSRVLAQAGALSPETASETADPMG